MNVDILSMELALFILGFTGKSSINYDSFMCLTVVLIFANSAEPGEMPHYTAFHLGLHYLPKYPFAGFQNEKAKHCKIYSMTICYVH